MPATSESDHQRYFKGEFFNRIHPTSDIRRGRSLSPARTVGHGWEAEGLVVGGGSGNADLRSRISNSVLRSACSPRYMPPLFDCDPLIGELGR